MLCFPFFCRVSCYVSCWVACCCVVFGVNGGGIYACLCGIRCVVCGIMSTRRDLYCVLMVLYCSVCLCANQCPVFRSRFNCVLFDVMLCVVCVLYRCQGYNISMSISSYIET